METINKIQWLLVRRMYREHKRFLGQWNYAVLPYIGQSPQNQELIKNQEHNLMKTMDNNDIADRFLIAMLLLRLIVREVMCIQGHRAHRNSLTLSFNFVVSNKLYYNEKDILRNKSKYLQKPCIRQRPNIQNNKDSLQLNNRS